MLFSDQTRHLCIGGVFVAMHECLAQSSLYIEKPAKPKVSHNLPNIGLDLSSLLGAKEHSKSSLEIDLIQSHKDSV